MMKHEFIARVNDCRIKRNLSTNDLMQDFPEEDYAIVEFVYNWHPSIPDVGGKDTIAALYELGGMRLIRDMVKTAEHAEQRDAEIQEIRKAVELALRDLGELTGKKYAIMEV